MISITGNLEQGKNIENDEVMSRDDVIDYLKISPSTLYRWCEDGLIRYSRIRRKKLFRKVDVNNMLEIHSSENISPTTT